MSILLLGHGYVSQYFCQKFAGQGEEIAASIHKNKDKYLPTSEAIETVNCRIDLIRKSTELKSYETHRSKSIIEMYR